MKRIAIISIHPGAGQTTLTVNLGSALALKGSRVLVLTVGDNHKLYDYLDAAARHKSNHDFRDANDPIVKKTWMGMDILGFTPKNNKPAESAWLTSFMVKTDYDYLLLIPAAKSDCKLLADFYEHLIVCVDFSSEKEIEALIALDKEMQQLPVNNKSVSLIVPNKMNSKEWEHNSHELFALADYFGAEKIADPIPICERVHDLPKLGITIWQLNRQNLQDAFRRLAAAVEML